MTRATKALLWSALVFPGAGHLYLRRYGAGAALVAVTAWATYRLVSIALAQAQAVLDEVARGAVAADPQTIVALASQQAAAADSTPARLATWVLLGCWLVGMVDAYRVGRRLG